MSRYLVLDTETTGLEVSDGHRIIELGAVELIDRRLTGNNFHQYIKPNREIDPGAVDVHGITNDFLADKPVFEEVLDQFINYLQGTDELIIHNASFDVGFLNHEFSLAGESRKIADFCEVCDSLALARKQFPGKRNSLDALCQRLDLDNSHRTLHGALLDAEILADVYLLMTGGQETMAFDDESPSTENRTRGTRKVGPLPVIKPSVEELEQHEAWCDRHGLTAW